MLYIITKTVYFGIVVLQILMFLRAAFSWMPDDTICFRICIHRREPIMAVRGFLERFDFVRGLPFDISFFVTFMILVILQNALPTVAV